MLDKSYKKLEPGNSNLQFDNNDNKFGTADLVWCILERLIHTMECWFKSDGTQVMDPKF